MSLNFNLRAASFLLVSIFSQFASAADVSKVRDCVSAGYKNISNRHAIVAAVVDENETQVMTFGAATIDQIFEIGSISKTFTANLLAQAIKEGALRLADSIPKEYQKAGSIITYQHLTTHTSGIVNGIFPNFQITNSLAPYEGLSLAIFKNLFQTSELAASPGTQWSYSNNGAALLGLILAEKSGLSYEDLLSEKILKKLDLNETYFEVPLSKLSRFPTGHMIGVDGQTLEIPHWDLYKTAMDPAGGLRSTISDMAKYAQANLNPQSSVLGDSLESAQAPLFFVKEHNLWMGMNWIVQPDLGLVWHNGETFGFNSILAISKNRKLAVVAMTDTTVLRKSADGTEAFDTALQDVVFQCLR